MKSFAFALLATLMVSASSVTAQDACDQCAEWVQPTLNHLTEQESIDTVTLLFITTVCPQMPDLDGCVAGVNTWWPEMVAYVAAPEQGTAKTICQAAPLNCAGKKRAFAFDCDTCKARLTDVSTALGNSEAALTATLNSWCDTTADGEACKGFVTPFAPLAIPALAGALQTDQEQIHICSEVYGVCE